MKARFLVLGVLLGALTLLTVPASTQQNTIIIGTTDGITTLDVADSYDYWTWHVFQNTSEGLVDFERGTAKVVPHLAQHIAVTGNGTEYWFTLTGVVIHDDKSDGTCEHTNDVRLRAISPLEQGQDTNQNGFICAHPADNKPKFWDGADFNADAVVFSLNRAKKLNGPNGAWEALMYDVVSVEKVDDYTVKIVTKGPDATFLPRLAGCACAFIMSPKSTPADKIASGQYAGTGRYKLARWDPDKQTVYESFPEYWNKAQFPKTPRIITQFFPEGAAPQLAAALRAGNIDIAFHTLNPEDVLALEKDPNVNVIRGESLNIRYLVINVTRPPFDDVRVRKAIALAVDRDKIVKQVFLGINEPLYSMVPPGFKDAYIKAMPDRNVAEARKLLEEYLKEKGLNPPLRIKFTATTRYGDTERDVALIVARALEETGIFRVEIEILERVTFFQRLGAGQMDFFALGWFPDFIDPDNFLGPWLVDDPEGMGTFFNHHPAFAEYKALFDKARSLVDPAKYAERMAIYKQIQQLVARDVPLVPLWLNKLQNIIATRKNISGAEIDASAILRTWLLEKK
jgi:peptide/nickel transport system substrate-binding protein